MQYDTFTDYSLTRLKQLDVTELLQTPEDYVKSFTHTHKL